MNNIKKVLVVIKYILLVFMFIILGIVVIQRFSNNKIKLFGYSIYNIVSESMKPVYEIGDVVIAKRVNELDLRVKDIIVYRGEKGDFKDKIVTHRLVGIKGGNPNTYITKGDSNQVEDPSINFNQIEGRIVRKSIILSFIGHIAKDNVLFFAIIFIPFTILVFLDAKDIIKDKKSLSSENSMEESKEVQNEDNK